MPDSVAAATASVVLPRILARAYRQTRTHVIDQNRYPDGSVQSGVISDESRKSFQITERLTAAQLATLIDFYIDMDGPNTTFYMYDPFETSPKYSYDGTGTASTGRYIVRFAKALQYSLDLGRNPAQFDLIQVS